MNNKITHFATVLFTAITFISITSCSTLMGSELHSDDSLRSDIALSLGMNPQDISIESRKNQGNDTYLTIETNKGEKMACSFYGGGIMGLGMKTQPTCNKIDSNGAPSGPSPNCNPLLKAAGKCK
jgi:hypothetical protein